MAGIRSTPDSNLQSVTINYTSSATGQNPQLQVVNSPGGGNTSIQYNLNGKFAGDSNFVWNTKNRTLSILGNIRISDSIVGKYNTNTKNLKISGGNVGDVLSTDGTGNIFWAENLSSYGNSNVANYLPTYTGNVSANYFIGNGSQLTGLPAGYSNTNAGAYLSSYTGNIGKLNFQYANTLGVITGANGSFLKLGGPDDTILGGDQGNVAVWSSDSIEMRTGIDGINDKITKFLNNGDISLAGGGILGNPYEDNNNTAGLQAGPGGYAIINSNDQNQYVQADDDNVYIGTDWKGNNYYWTFNKSGNLTLPAGGNVSINYSNGQPYGGGVTGNITIAGTSLSIGDGATETEIMISPSGPVASWAYLQLPNNETANVANTRLHNDAGNIEIGAADYSTGSTLYNWYFDNTGNFTLPSNLTIGPLQYIAPVYGTGLTQNSNEWISLTSTGTAGATQIYWNEDPGISGNFAYFELNGDSMGTARLTVANNGGFINEWNFDKDGAINLPYPGTVRGTIFNAVSNNFAQLQWVDSGNINIPDPNGSDGPKNWIFVDQFGVWIETNMNTGYGSQHTWKFNNSGELLLPNDGRITNPPNSSLDPLNPNVSTLVLSPDFNYSSQSLVLDPTAPGHIHLRAPSYTDNSDEPLANIFLGGELSSFEVGYSSNGAPNVFVHSNNYTWTFGTDGRLTLPNTAYIDSGIPTIQTGQDFSIGVGDPQKVWNFDQLGTLTLPGGTSVIESTANNVSIYNEASQTNGVVIWGDGLGNAGVELQSDGMVSIVTDNSNAARQTVFLPNGNLQTAGGIIPVDPNNFDIGNSNNYFRDAYFSGNVNADVFKTTDGGITHTGGAVGITADSGKDTYLYADGGNVGWIFTTGGNLEVPGSIVYTAGASPAPYISGFSSITTTDGGNINNFVFGNGNLTLPGNTFSINYANGTQVSLSGANTGNFTFSNNNINTASNSSNITLNITGVGAKSWIFATSGDFYNPGNIQGGNFVATGNFSVNNWISTPGGTNLTVNPGTSQVRIIANTEPYHNDSWYLGTASARWKNVYSNAGNFSGSLYASSIQLTSTGTAVNASQGNILTNQVTGTHFNFMSGVYTASLTGSGTLSANYTMYLPANTGTNGQVLTSNGSGGLSWTTASGSYDNSNVSTFLASFGSNTISTTGNVTIGNLTFGANAGQINFNTGAYISGNANSITRDGSIRLEPYTGAGSTFPGVIIGGAGRLLSPAGSVHQIFNTSDVTFQVLTKITSGTSATSTNNGALILTGTGGIGVGGNVIAGGTTTTGVGAFVGGATNTLLSNTVAGFTGNVNSYTQVTFQNKNTGADATADFILTADNGSDTVNYGDFGIINSGYDNLTPTNSLGNIVYAADTYLYAQGNVSNTTQSGGNLAIGTTTVGKSVKIFAGGVTNSNIVATISNTGVAITGNITANNLGNISSLNLNGSNSQVLFGNGSYANMSLISSGSLVLNKVVGPATNWTGTYTSSGGRLLITAYASAFVSGVGSYSWALQKNGSNVATGTMYWNSTSTHLPLNPISYIDTSGSVGLATWTLVLGAGMTADSGDYATISVVENTGVSGLTAAGLVNTNYLLAQNSVDQTGVTNGTAINFQTTLNSNGTFINKVSNTQVTLTAGKTYRLEAIIRRFTSSSTWGAFRWYDVTNATYIGAEGFGETATSGTAAAGTTVATAIVSPNTNTTYELRQTTVNTITVSALYGTIEVTQLDPATSLTTVTTINATGNITSSTTVSGLELTSTQSNGDEGGQINLNIPATNTSLANSVTVDVYQNRLRMFEGSANAKGVFVDLNKAPNGVGGELLYKASGFVNAGVDVTLGNLKARIPTSGNRSLQVSTVSGTYSIYGSSVYSQNGVSGSTIDAGAPKSVTTTPTYLNSGYNFATGGATDCWVVMDTSAGFAWRISLIVGSGYNNNFISIERL